MTKVLELRNITKRFASQEVLTGFTLSIEDGEFFTILGPSGCGKTTVLRRSVELLRDRCLSGFYTEEIRHRGSRVGFRAIGLGGSSAILAHTNFGGPRREAGTESI